MKKLTFKEFLIEAPLHDFERIGNFDKARSFHSKRDRRILQHPRAIEMVRKKFGNTDYDFNFYFVNTEEAKNHTEVGLVPFEWLEKNLGKEVSDAVRKNLDKDHINVVFTNNRGDEKVPLTAWMMAHRLGHALARKDGKADVRGQYQYASNHLMSQVSSMMDAYGIEKFPDRDQKMWSNRTHQLAMINFFQSVCTFRSAREKKIRNWFEVLNELIAQYLTTGTIKFNKAPQCFGSNAFGRNGRHCTKDLEDVNDILEMLGRDMGMLIDDILSSVVNGVLVM